MLHIFMQLSNVTKYTSKAFFMSIIITWFTAKLYFFQFLSPLTLELPRQLVPSAPCQVGMGVQGLIMEV